MEYGQLEICKTLVQSGADISAFNNFGFSPLGNAFLPRNLWINRQGIVIFHHLLNLCGNDCKNSWVDEDSMILYVVDTMLDDSDDQQPLQNIDQHLRDWMSICRFIDFDLNGLSDLSNSRNLNNLPNSSRLRDLISSLGGSSDLNRYGQFTFLEVVIYVFSIEKTDDLELRLTLFDAFIRVGIGTTSSADTWNIPTIFAALWVYWTLELSFKESLVAAEASPMLSVFYRGLYIHPNVARNLTFLEFVISKGIAQRPDSIFDTFSNLTPFGVFNFARWPGIWEEILEEHKFDIDWVYEERKRRKRVITGETTAHEVDVDVDVDVSKALEMKRRRGYRILDD